MAPAPGRQSFARTAESAGGEIAHPHPRPVDTRNLRGSIGESDTEHLVEVRRGIGADEQDALPRIGEPDRSRARERGLPDASLPVKKRNRLGCSRTLVKTRSLSG